MQRLSHNTEFYEVLHRHIESVPTAGALRLISFDKCPEQGKLTRRHDPQFVKEMLKIRVSKRQEVGPKSRR